jgi:hypothetical protein
MNIKKPLLIAGAVTSIAAAGVAGNALVSAQTSSSGNDSLASKIAQKFNLKTEDVQAVFDEDKAAKQADHQALVEKDLTQAVTDGKLTSDQKDKILAKQKELQAARDAERTAMAGKTEAERHAVMEAKKAEMDAKRAELQKWATDNGIPTEYLRYVMGHGGRGHGGHNK